MTRCTRIPEITSAARCRRRVKVAAKRHVLGEQVDAECDEAEDQRSKVSPRNWFVTRTNRR